MVGIPPIFTSQGETEWSRLCITTADLAATTRRSVATSLVVEFELLVAFKRKFVFSDETIMEEWSAFYQYSHLKAKPSDPLSVLAQLSLPQPLGRNVVASLVIEFEICWVFKSHFVFLS
jgi:hypothetical protein